ncbi:MAG: hypothetical protein DBY08_01230 [Clostridiales bacterium]|nr:MAG: hypothetical protein DBY08_01230 [Clostridiales bacterium]
MMGQMSRRRVKKRKRPNENSKMKFTMVLGIMIVAVLLGYLTARFVIGPLLGYDADESPIKIANNKAEQDDTVDNSNQDTDSKDKAADNEGSKNSEETGSDSAPDQGYALQFGVFTSKEAAQKLKEELQAKGIETKVVQEDDNYKVISTVVKTKDEAIEELNGIKDKEVEDVFIASF